MNFFTITPSPDITTYFFKDSSASQTEKITLNEGIVTLTLKDKTSQYFKMDPEFIEKISKVYQMNANTLNPNDLSQEIQEFFQKIKTDLEDRSSQTVVEIFSAFSGNLLFEISRLSNYKDHFQIDSIQGGYSRYAINFNKEL